MTTLTYNFEGGTSGSTILSTDTGSGDSFTSSALTGVRVYTNTSPIKGTLSGRVSDSTAAASALIGWDAQFNGGTPPQTNGVYWFRFYFKVQVAPSAAGTNIVQTRNASTFGGGMQINSGLTVVAVSKPGTTVTGSGYVISLNTVYRAEGLFDPGTSTTTGRCKYVLYAGDDTASPLVNVDVSGLDLGSAPLTTFRLGKTATTSTCDYVFDAVQVSDTATALIGPVAANNPPTVTVGGAVTTALGSVTSMTATASDTDGTIASYLWAQTSGTTVTLSGGSTATATFTAPSAGHYTFTCTVTDNGGASTTSATKTVYITSAVSRPETLYSNTGAWTAQGTASFPGALSDESNSTYIQSTTNPVSAVAIRFLMTPLTTGSNTFSYTIDQSASSPQQTSTITLLQGPSMTTIAQWTEVTTTTITTRTQTLTTGQQAALTDGNNLYLDISSISA